MKKDIAGSNITKVLFKVFQALIVSILCFLSIYFNIFSALDSLYKDKLYQIPRGMNNNIKIIAIDVNTLNKYGPVNTWDRSLYNDVLTQIGDYASVVAYDVMFMGEMEEGSDNSFKENVLSRDNVVVASHLVFDKLVETDENGNMYVNNKHISEVEKPFFGEGVTQGFTNVSTDEDGVVRRMVPAVKYVAEDGTVANEYSFAYSIYKKYAEKNGISPLDYSYNERNIYYAGKPFDYEAISMADILEGKRDPRIFTGCVVLVGAYVTGLQDQFSVPNSTNQMYGVEINANIVQGYIDDCFPVDADRLIVSIALSLIIFVLYIIFTNFHIRWGSFLFILCEAASVVAGILLYTKAFISVSMLYFNIFLAITYIATLVVNYIREVISKRRMSNAFRKYVAPQVVDDIMKNGQYNIKLGGENKDIAVLFVDIRGFTPLSESLPPEKVVEILNRYLNLTTNAVFKNSGTLDKFIGDATMAVFNAPFNLEDYEYKAVCAAFDIVAGAKELEEVCMEKYGRKVAFGVGVNCGEAVVGNIGCDFRMDYTAIGDTVNTAARLEANAKAGQVLISQKIYDRLKDRIKVNEVGVIPLKGKSEGVFVYELVDINPPTKDN
jgi:adenylate cyclase